MKASKISEWLQVIGSFGVLAGLILVALQIQQNTVLVRAELVSNASDAWINIDASKQSENFASVLAKSIVNPQELTPLAECRISALARPGRWIPVKLTTAEPSLAFSKVRDRPLRLSYQDGVTFINGFPEPTTPGLGANGVNDAGQVTGAFAGEAFLWDPVDGTARFHRLWRCFRLAPDRTARPCQRWLGGGVHRSSTRTRGS